MRKTTKRKIIDYWQAVKPEFSKALAEQILQDLAEAQNQDELRIILRTIRAKINSEAQKTAFRIFRRAIKLLFD